MEQYLQVNLAAYDSTAEEFQIKKQIRENATIKLTDEFIANINRYTATDKPYSLLELGPGSGYASMLLSEMGHSVTAIEFSKPMAELAQQTAPKATVIHDEFIAHNFDNQTYDGILGIAFIHLFPARIVPAVCSKIFGLLNKGGLVTLSTTKHANASEGYEIKTNFDSKEKRFRHRYTRQELTNLLANASFKILSFEQVEDAEVEGKIWMDFVATK